jgi:hypothetical protein
MAVVLLFYIKMFVAIRRFSTLHCVAGSTATPVSRVHASSMLLLHIIRGYEVSRCVYLLCHNFHTKFR